MDPQSVVYRCGGCERELRAPVEARNTVCPYCGCTHTDPVPSFSEIMFVHGKPFKWRPDDPTPSGNPEPMARDPKLKKALDQITREVDQRRLRAVYVPERMVFEAFVQPTRLPDYVAVLDAESLPEGYEVLPGAHHDWRSRCFVFLVRHPTFDPVPDGTPTPEWPGGPVLYRLVEVVRAE